jgi:hypothetical protein
MLQQSLERVHSVPSDQQRSSEATRVVDLAGDAAPQPTSSTAENRRLNLIFMRPG